MGLSRGGSGNKGHAVVVPFPAQGHVNPMMQLAKLLHSRGFHVTFVNTEFNHNRLVRSKGADFVAGSPGFAFETIPDGLPPSDRDATQDVPSLCDSTRNNCYQPFKELLSRLEPPVSCVVGDALMGFAIKAGQELGVPKLAQFWTSAPCSFIGCMMFKVAVDKGIVPFKDDSFLRDGTLDKVLMECPGMPHNIRLRDLPSFIRTQSTEDIMFDFIGSEARNCLNSPALIFNTFTDLDRDVLDAISSEYYLKPNDMYTIGPLPLMLPENSSSSLSLWIEDTSCLDWLDKKEPGSVVYVNYGSITTMTHGDLIEFAWGLANSAHNFLWIVRPDVVEGSDTSAVGLPAEFYKAIEGRGLLATWCPQQRVLAHPSVAFFLTHCGWNSTLESLSHGVPILCWPFFGDQPTTCRLATTAWGFGVEVNALVQRDQLAALVKEVMEGDKGGRLKESMSDWKAKAVKATRVGGSSFNHFNNLLDYLSSPPLP